MISLKIEKLVEGGQGFAFFEGKTYFVWNALPGEEVEVDVLKHRKGIYDCLATNILSPSPHRINSKEEHFLSCSPWQIMDWEYENEMKRNIALENYERIGKLEVPGDLNIYSDDIKYGYRNKMEFSFIEKEGKISLALFKRGQRGKIALDQCDLASSAINETAKKILGWINEEGLTERNLKTLIVRSNKKGETIAGLFIKDRIDFSGRDMPWHVSTKKSLLGFSIYYSTHKSPASVITDTLYREGQDFLTEEIDGKTFKYGINSFFQVNIPVFGVALKDISNAIEDKRDLVDLYSGVGVIGLSVGANALVELNGEAIGFARENIEANRTSACEAILSPAEKSLEYIKEGSAIIFDPPRAGLHQDVIERILEVRPEKIIYLSCNTATQARDIGLLKDLYKIKLLKLYNFFPRTPHIESMAVLELK